MHRKLCLSVPALIAVALVPESLIAAPPAGERISFVSCPIVRDTRTVPCWLSDYDGETYYLTIQSDVSAAVQPPMLGHQVLVEGIVSAAPEVCGGIVLEPLRISAMPELDANCNTMLPADERYTIDVYPRPPGPSAGRLAFAPDPNAPPPAPLPPLEGAQTIELFFDFDKSVGFGHPGTLIEILDVAAELDAQQMRITGVTGAHRLSDGTLLRESQSIGQRRAEEVAALLLGAGLNLAADIDWTDGDSEADGVDDWQSRRVTVELFPLD